MFAKRLSLTAAAVTTIATTGFAATQAGGAGPAASASRLKPLVIHETFTPLPCAGAPGHRTTLQMEGCAEKQILRTDIQIDVLESQIFPILFDDRARRDLNAAQRAWLSYRKADCLSMSDLFEGGTEAGAVDAKCEADRNGHRVKDLRALHKDLTAGSSRRRRERCAHPDSQAGAGASARRDGRDRAPHGRPPTFPFVDVANLYTSWYSTVAPQRLAGMTWTQIIRSLKRPRSAAAQAVAGEAEVVTAELCSVTHGRPQSVCSPALVAQYRQGLPGMDGRGGGCPAYRALARRRGRLPVAGAARCHI